MNKKEIESYVNGFIDEIEDEICYKEKQYHIFNTEQVSCSLEVDVYPEAETYVENLGYNEDDNKYDEVLEEKTNELFSKYEKEIINGILKYFEEKGFKIYDGEFFPCEGNFKSLSAEEIAIVKNK